jgi:NAD(P)H dehydrogenase (quinone)
MIWQFPLWWYSVPAIVKGWVDRVFAIGRAYGQGQMYETEFSKGKKPCFLSQLAADQRNTCRMVLRET